MNYLMKKSLLFTILFLFAWFGKAYAQDTGSGLDFLNIAPSPQLLALSQAGSASETGPSAIYTNPSLLAFAERSSLDLSYTLWISGVDNQFAAANLRRGDLAAAIGVFSSTADQFEARDQPGEPAGTFSINYLSLSGALAYRVGPVSVGATAQYLREEVFQFIANGYAFNLGVSAELLDSRVRMGASLNNIGEMESLDMISTPVPSTFNAGVSAALVEFTTPGADDLPLLLSLHADWSRPLEESTTSDFISGDPDDGFFTLALSAELADLFTIRSGYRFGPTERPFSIGMGVMIEPVKVNYALVPFSTGFGTVHSFGVQYYF